MLALRYRPQRFTDLSGQDHVVVVLKQMLRHHFAGKGLPAAFLFAGTKGTGKTTSARVVAAALNCQSEYAGHKDYDVEPCCYCESCQSVRQSNCLFVHEMDAASSGLVDDVRKIKELASLSHTGKVRVIIIDEAHSLSKAAFEALLKQLEEPLSNVLYIFATTDPSAFPTTVLSRVMQFSFKELVPDIIQARLMQIATNEKIAIADAKVLNAISVKAGGAMRDAIMMMEQLSHYRSPLNLNDFLDYYGLVGPEISSNLIEMARSADIVGAKHLIETNFTRSVDVAYFLDNFMLSVTNSLQVKALTSVQVVEAYKAAVEVKSKLKFMSAFVAANYLFALLLRMFSHEGQISSALVSKDKLQEMFQ